MKSRIAVWKLAGMTKAEWQLKREKADRSKALWRRQLELLQLAANEGGRASSLRLYRRLRDGDPGALVEALVAVLRVELIRADTTEDDSRHDHVEVPRWAAQAALGYVLHAVGGFRIKGLPLSKRGGSGAFGRRLRREMDDLHVHDAVTAARVSEGTLEGALFAVEEEHGIPAGTAKRAFHRAHARLEADPARYEILGPFFDALRRTKTRRTK